MGENMEKLRYSSVCDEIGWEWAGGNNATVSLCSSWTGNSWHVFGGTQVIIYLHMLTFRY